MTNNFYMTRAQRLKKELEIKFNNIHQSIEKHEPNKKSRFLNLSDIHHVKKHLLHNITKNLK